MNCKCDVWEVVVENVGTVLNTLDEDLARQEYESYCAKAGQGLIGGGIYLFFEGDLEEEFDVGQDVE